jgi:hypothetical protein
MAKKTLKISDILIKRECIRPGVGHQALKSAMDQVTIAKLV